MEQESKADWNLQFSYVDYERRNKNLEKSKIDKYYIFQKLGGSGQFGKVYRGMDGLSKKEVALKILDKREVQNEKSANKKRLRKRLIESESQIMKKITSQNVLKFYDCLQNRDLKIMIIEYCNNGSLYDLLQERGRLPEDEAVVLFKQVINGVADFHKQKIIHRDLKLQNILIHNGQCKIADFGFSKVLAIKNENEIVKNTILGSLITMAPEVMRKQSYGLKADIWSLGVIFFQLIFGRNPFKYDGVDINKCFNDGLRIINGQQEYEGIRPSNQAKKFIRQVLVIDQEKRLGWRDVLGHELFKVQRQAIPTRFYRRVDLKQNDAELEQIQRQYIKSNLSSAPPSAIVQYVNPKQQMRQTFEHQNQKPQHQPQQVKEKTKQQIIPKSQTQEKPIPEKSQNSNAEIPSDIPPAKIEIHKKEQKKEEFKIVKDPQIKPKSQQIYIKKQDQPKPQKINEPGQLGKKTVIKAPNFKNFNPVNIKVPFKEIEKVENSINLPSKIIKPPINPEPEQKSPIVQKRQVPKGEIAQRPQAKVIIRQPIFEKPKEKPITVSIRDDVREQMKFKHMDRYSVSEQQSKNVQNEINRDDDEIYKWTQKIHTECLRAEFIYNNIVKLIEKHNLLELNDRDSIELMYLICTRCRNNISPIYNEYNKRKNTKQGKVILDLRNFVEPLYRIITGKWNTYCNELTRKQNEKIVMFKDFFSKRIFSSDFQKKDRFLTGVENMQEFKPSNAPKKTEILIEGKRVKQQNLQDYTKQEQIQFTNQCIQAGIKKVRFLESNKELRNTMNNFKNICLLKAEGMKPEVFKEELRRISQKQ